MHIVTLDIKRARRWRFNGRRLRAELRDNKRRIHRKERRYIRQRLQNGETDIKPIRSYTGWDII